MVTSIWLLACLALMVHAVAHSHRKLRTVLYGVLAIAGTLGVTQVLVSALSLNGAVMGHVAAALIFIVPAYVMRTHSRSTQPAMKPKADAAGGGA